MLQHSSGDMIADRRYRYARELLREGDGKAAAELFRQTLDIAPAWAPAWFGFGEALERAGDRFNAVTAFRRALSLAPDDALGAKLRLARLGAGPAGQAMSEVYVRRLFDQYADNFDRHLREKLEYRGPEIILEALRALHDGEPRFDRALDLGCGTGLMAAVIRSHVGAIDGVDLSHAMVAKAKGLGLYREVWDGELTERLAILSAGAERYDLLLAADVLVYLGDLAPVLAAAASAMAAPALFAFTVQAHEGDGFLLGEDLRYHHSSGHIEAAAAAAGLAVASVAPCVTRQNFGEPVPGLVVVLRKADG